MRKLIFAVSTLCLCLMIASSAGADVITIPQSALIPTTSYYTDDLGSALIMTGGGAGANVGESRNDDGYTGPIDLGFTLNFYGNEYTQFWANNNGNISFGGGISAYTPTGPQGASQPIISPFFGDVDTRNPESGLMYLNNSVENQIIVTWDQVGYYNQKADLLNSFQLVLRGPDYVVPAGEGQIGFFWLGMGWETGDASGGTGGFGGTPAAVGFGDGALNGQVLAGSIEDGISGVVQYQSLWFSVTAEGEPVVIPPSGVPEPASLLLFGLGLIGLAGIRRKMRN